MEYNLEEGSFSDIKFTYFTESRDFNFTYVTNLLVEISTPHWLIYLR